MGKARRGVGGLAGGLGGFGGGGGGGSSVGLSRGRERANLSFFIVIIFFAVFTVIVLTEIFLIDERGRNAARRQPLSSSRSARGGGHHQDYDDGQLVLQAEDYIVYHAGLEDPLRGEGRKPRLTAGGAGGRLQNGAVGGIRPAANQKNPADPMQSRLPPLPNITASPGSWQNVPGTRYKFYVFSAYYDWRMTRLVRVIGATKTRGPERVWCRLWSTNSTSAAAADSISVPGKVKVIRENWNLKYSACFVLCPLRENQTVPASVSVVSRLRIVPTNHLAVHNMRRAADRFHKGDGDPQMAVCVKPLHFNYNQSLQMVEFLELNSLLGVKHVTLYNDTVSGSTSCLLREYQSLGMVSVLPWRLDMVSQREIRTEGLFAALNDCLYRSMYTYAHVALIDLDEFIMPKHNDTLPQLLQFMGTRMNTRSTGSYSFQNAFFYLQWPDDMKAMTAADPLQGSLVTQRKTRRRAKLHPHKQRSKYICRPEFVVEAGNHFVWEFVPGHGTLNVPPDAAILNHYRVCEFGGDDCVKSVSVVDRTALRYGQRLVTNVRRRWDTLRERCGLGQIPTTRQQGQPGTDRLTRTSLLPPKVKAKAKQPLPSFHPN